MTVAARPSIGDKPIPVEPGASASLRPWRPSAVGARLLGITEGEALTLFVAVIGTAALLVGGVPPVLRDVRRPSIDAAAPHVATDVRNAPGSRPDDPAEPRPVIAPGAGVLTATDALTMPFPGASPAAPAELSVFAPAVGGVSVFARVGPPGAPHGLATAPDGTVYVATNNGAAQGHQGPSQILSFDRTGAPSRRYEIAGQSSDHALGVMGVALDGNGSLIALDASSARILRVDLASGAQAEGARLPDLPPCLSPLAVTSSQCEPGLIDRRPRPDSAAFDASGNLYVTDPGQATIWRLAPGPGRPLVWYQSVDLATDNGLGGLAYDGRGAIVFASPATLDPEVATGGAVYRLSLGDDMAAGTRQLVAGFPGDEQPCGVALYPDAAAAVTLCGANAVVLLDGHGTEQRRIVSGSTDVPFDTPTGVTRHGDTVLVTNQAPSVSSNWAILAVGLR